jgi:hypothetical protein
MIDFLTQYWKAGKAGKLDENNPFPPFLSSIFPHELEFLCGKTKKSQQKKSTCSKIVFRFINNKTQTEPAFCHKDL